MEPRPLRMEYKTVFLLLSFHWSAINQKVSFEREEQFILTSKWLKKSLCTIKGCHKTDIDKECSASFKMCSVFNCIYLHWFYSFAYIAICMYGEVCAEKYAFLYRVQTPSKKPHSVHLYSLHFSLFFFCLDPQDNNKMVISCHVFFSLPKPALHACCCKSSFKQQWKIMLHCCKHSMDKHPMLTEYTTQKDSRKTNITKWAEIKD